MSSQPLKFVFLGSLALSMIAGNAAAMAQYNPNGDVVVPTTSGGNRTTTGTSTPTSTSNSTNTTSTSTVDSGTRFSCQLYNGQYTVMYQPESQPSQYFPWATPRALGGGWDARSRCDTIAQRLETYRPDGLTELQTSTANGYNILCVTTEAKPSCRIVLTVPPEKDAYQVRNDVFQNLISADSGEQTFGVNTYANRGRGSEIDQIRNMGRTLLGNGKNSSAVSKDPINLKPFLDRKDGGSARLMKNGVSIGKPKPQSNGLKLPSGLR